MAELKEPLIPHIGVVTDIRIDTPDVKTFRVVTPDGKKAFEHKPGAAIAVARRGGITASFDVLNKYFTIKQMPVVASTYWNGVHGRVPGEAALDEEGMRTMRNIGHNMAWMLKCIELGRENGIEPPVAETGAMTNFIR